MRKSRAPGRALLLCIASLGLLLSACGEQSPAPQADRPLKPHAADQGGIDSARDTRPGWPAPSADFPPPPLQSPPFDGPKAYGLGVPPELRGKMDRFVLDQCPLCATRLGTRGETVVISLDGREVRLCSGHCHARLDADLDAARLRIDGAQLADQAPHYPTSVSLLDEQPLGETPIDFIWGNRHFKARDEAEKQAILADPLPALRTLDRAVVKSQRPGYGMPDTCPVQGDILENESKIDIVVANRMIRVCCERCVRMVREHPSQYLSMVEYASRAAAAERDADAQDATVPEGP